MSRLDEIGLDYIRLEGHKVYCTTYVSVDYHVTQLSEENNSDIILA